MSAEACGGRGATVVRVAPLCMRYLAASVWAGETGRDVQPLAAQAKGRHCWVVRGAAGNCTRTLGKAGNVKDTTYAFLTAALRPSST